LKNALAYYNAGVAAVNLKIIGLAHVYMKIYVADEPGYGR
jgi:hypothetical protein